MTPDTDRGVSEVLGFIIIFSLITMTMSILYVGNIGALEERRDAQRINNAESAFSVLASNIEDIDRYGVPSRATEIKLADASLELGESTSLRIAVIDSENITIDAEEGIRASNSDESLAIENGRIRYEDGTVITYQDPIVTDWYESDARPIVYRTGSSRLVYENGAVIRANDDSAVMKREPDIRLDGSAVFVGLVETSSSGTANRVGGTTTTLVRTRNDGTTVKTPMGNEGPSLVAMEVETTTERAVAWYEYLDSRSTCHLRDNDTTVYCAFLLNGDDTLTITETSVGTSLS